MSAADKNDALVIFLPSGKRGRFARSTSILSAARSLGVDVDSVCGGRAICGRCQIEVAEGEFAKHGVTSSVNSVSPCGAAEEQFRSRRGLAAERRLSCQSLIENDVVIDVPASSQVHHQVVRKPHEAHDITIDPVVHAYFVEVAEPELHEAMGDLERLQQGTFFAKKILAKMKIDPKTIIVTKIRGAHPGGTAAIGDIVNNRLETKINGLLSLYVSCL